jgi:hypothetical protein
LPSPDRTYEEIRVNWRLSAACTALVAATAAAQEVPGAEGPTSGPRLGDGPHPIATTTFAARRIVAPSRRVALPRLDARPFLDEDALAASVPALNRDPRVAVTRWFHEVRAPRRLVAGAPGVATMPDGSLVWTAEIQSPGAVGLRLHASRFDLPEGATLVVVNAADPSESYGPFEGGGPRGTGGRFFPTVFGDTARVEIRVPAESTGARLLFSVDRAAHRYRERAAGMEDPRVASPDVPMKSASCENDVACDTNYVQDVARAVATMEITASNGVFLCSGALLNDSDPLTNIPYFLTAHHCISSESDANNTEFYFDYRADTCGGVAPKLSNVPRVSGATLLASSATSDYTLLRLTGTLPSNRFFCGWTAGRQNTGEALVGVHHPAPGGYAQPMKISYGSLLDPDGNFHQVQWSSGVTAPGSSGSPLFNPQKQVIGQLYGGQSSCSLRSGIDEYGRFDRTYPALRPWLGDGPAATTDDGNDPLDDTPAGATELVPTYFDQLHGPHSLSKTDLADWFSMFLEAGAHYRFFSSGVDDVQAVLYADQLQSVVVASDDQSGGSGQFSIDFVPTDTATYYMKVSTPVAGSAAEYTLYYTQVRPDLVRPPAAVRGLKKTLAGSIVKLRWTDVARNEAGYYVDISEDDGQTWKRAGELPRNSRAFNHDPGPGRRLYRVGAWNEGPTIHWRQIAVTIVDPNQLDAADPADDVGDTATVLTPADGGITPTHTLSRVDAEDWYQIDLVAGSSYVFQTTGAGDTYGEVFADPSGDELLAFNDDAGAGRNFHIVFRPPTTATYWVRVTPRVDGAVLSYALSWRKR